jgi:hypothetical protein
VSSESYSFSSSSSSSTLVGRGSRKPQRLTEAVGNANQYHVLGSKSRRAVVYRGPRLGRVFWPCSFIWAFVRCALVICRAIREPHPTKDEDEYDMRLGL